MTNNHKKAKIVKIEMTNLENIKPQYSNYVQISHTPNEFVINFCYVDQVSISGGDDPRALAECFSRIVVSPTLLPGIISALKINQEKYDEGAKKNIELLEKIKEK